MLPKIIKIHTLKTNFQYMVLGGGACGQGLGLQRGALLTGIPAGIRETSGAPFRPACEDTARRPLFVNW